jgi:hypothetical protein
MYWKKIGTKLANEDVAGTEHELNLALDSYHKRRKVQFTRDYTG